MNEKNMPGGFKLYSGNLCDDDFQREPRTRNFLNYIDDERNGNTPDVLCLQEAPSVLVDELVSRNYIVSYDSQAYGGQCMADSGLLLASRLPVSKYEALKLSPDGNITQMAKLAFKGVDLAVINVHQPCGIFKDSRRQKETLNLCRYAKQIKGIGGLVVAGDFNCFPSSSCKTFTRHGFKPVFGELATFPSQWSKENDNPGLAWYEKPFVKAVLSKGTPIQIDKIYSYGLISASNQKSIDEGRAISDHVQLESEFSWVGSLPVPEKGSTDRIFQLAA